MYSCYLSCDRASNSGNIFSDRFYTLTFPCSKLFIYMAIKRVQNITLKNRYNE